MHADSEKKGTTVFFLRHGQTDYPKNRYYDDSIEDPSLNESGLREVKRWPSFFEDNPPKVSAVYVSPSCRTRETAKIATEGLGLKHQIVAGLQEWHFGMWGGLTGSEIQNKYPDEWTAWRKDMMNFSPSGGESLSRFSKRANAAVAELIAQHANQTVLMVTHAGVIRVIVAAALEMPMLNFKRLVIGHASMTEIAYTDRWPNLHAFSYIPEIVNEETL